MKIKSWNILIVWSTPHISPIIKLFSKVIARSHNFLRLLYWSLFLLRSHRVQEGIIVVISILQVWILPFLSYIFDISQGRNILTVKFCKCTLSGLWCLFFEIWRVVRVRFSHRFEAIVVQCHVVPSGQPMFLLSLSFICFNSGFSYIQDTECSWRWSITCVSRKFSFISYCTWQKVLTLLVG